MHSHTRRHNRRCSSFRYTRIRDSWLLLLNFLIYSEVLMSQTVDTVHGLFLFYCGYQRPICIISGLDSVKWSSRNSFYANWGHLAPSALSWWLTSTVLLLVHKLCQCKVYFFVYAYKMFRIHVFFAMCNYLYHGSISFDWN